MLQQKWWNLARGCRIQNVTFLQKSYHSRMVRFDIGYAFKIFDENFNELKPVTLVGNEFDNKEPVFFFPGVEGKVKFVQDLLHKLRRPVYCFQYPFEKCPTDVSSLAENITQFVQDYARYKKKLNFVAHSFGGLVALSVIKEMQHSNKIHFCSMDSTPHAVKFMTRASFGDISNRAKFENDLLISTLQWMNVNDTKPFENVLEKHSEWNEKLKHFVEMVPEHPKFSKRNLCTVINGLYNSIRATLLYDEKSLGKLNAKMSLIRSSEKVLPFPDDFREEEYFSLPTRTLLVKGHHFNMLRSSETAAIINQELEIG